MTVVLRARIFAEGPGWQLRDYQEFAQLDELDEPTLANLDELVRSALDGFREALEDAFAANIEVAGRAGLPPGVSYQSPAGLVLVVEQLPPSNTTAV